MAEPKKRMTSTRSGNRKSHDAMSPIYLRKCSNCKETLKPYTVCQNCGFYRGKKVIILKEERLKDKKVIEELKDE